MEKITKCNGNANAKNVSTLTGFSVSKRTAK